MKKIVFDGQVYAQRVTGQYRYADEILKELDLLIQKDQYEIIVPEYVDLQGKFQNIKVVKHGKVKGILWTQTSFAIYLIRNNAMSVGFCNITPLARPGITVIHDIAYKVLTDNYRNLYGRLSSLWHRLHYWIVAKRSSCPIITVSNFSKKQIEEVYKVNPERIQVIGNAWQHMIGIGEDDEIFKANPTIEKNKYYFALGSLEERKNFKWIVDVAKYNPKESFVIAGGTVKNSSENLILSGVSNLHFVGYIPDEQVKSLMRHCKAFLFPSIFEGFGIPPLEALSVGTEVISSNTTSMPEVLDDCVHFIDPFKTDYSLDTLIQTPVADSQKVLDKYSWKLAANKLLNIIYECKDI